ncbi:MAG: glycosyltransferase, partial [Chitinophagaceae bacterium]
IEVYVITADTDLNETQSYQNIESNKWIEPIENSNVKVYYCSKDKLNKQKIVDIINEVKPTHIYLNHLWSYWFVLQPLFITWRKFKHIKIVLCPRGALFPSALHYKNTFLKKKAVMLVLKTLRIHKKIHFHATTIQEKEVIQQHFGNVEITIANNLPDLQQPSLSFIEKKQGELKLVFIARIVDIKNLKLLLQNLLLVRSNVNVNIAGPTEDEIYWNDCKSIIAKLPANVTTNYVGQITPSQVMPLIQEHHLYCLPTQGENFGHSIFEAFMIGRPVLISNKTPWLNLNKNKVGWDVDLTKENCLLNEIEEAASWTQQEFEAYCKGSWRVASDYISNTNLIADYNKLFSN